MRKLATVALSYSGAVFLSHYLLSMDIVPVAATLALFIALCAVIFKSGRRLRAVLMLSGLALGLLWSFGHYKIFIAPSEALSGTEQIITAKVIDYPANNDRYSSVDIKLDIEDVPKIGAKLYSYNGDMDFVPGDIISCKVSFRSASMIKDEETGINHAKGIFTLCTAKSEIEYLSRAKTSFLYFPLKVSKAIKEQVFRDYPEDVSHLMAALLTGDKTRLYDDLELNGAMSVSGISHVVAVSGMHLAFLVGMVRSLFSRKRRAAAISIPVIIFFILMTGARPSVIRAGVMQILILLAPLFSREEDSVTTLSLALFLLLLINPSMCESIGLQLSFGAMSGIITLTPRINEALMVAFKSSKVAEHSALKKLGFFVISSFSSTIGAIAFTTPLVAIYFGVISIVSPLTNLLCIPIVSLCFSLGFIIAPLGMVIPALGRGLALCIALPLRLIIRIVKAIGSLPFAAVYTSNPLVGFWLFVTYAIIFGAYLLRRKEGFRPTVPICVCGALLSLILLGSELYYDLGPGMVTVLDVGQGQSVAAVSGRGTVLIDCGSSSGYNPGRAAEAYLKGRVRPSIDLLVLTHLHSDHANGVPELFSTMRINHLALPLDDEELELEREILVLAEIQGTEIHYIEEDTLYNNGDLSLELIAPMGDKDVNERGVIILGEIKGFDFLVTGDVEQSIEKELVLSHELPELELLVAGHHGSRYASSEELLAATRPEIAVVSTGYNNYGHPTGEALYRLHESGAEIFRTDLNGNIEFKVK